MLFILCLINTCIIYHVNLKWRIITSYNSERFVQCEFYSKGKDGNVMKHWKSQGMSHWHQFRITLLILCQERLGSIPCAGAKRAAGFPVESCRAALAKRGHCVRGGAGSSETGGTLFVEVTCHLPGSRVHRQAAVCSSAMARPCMLRATMKTERIPV